MQITWQTPPAKPVDSTAIALPTLAGRQDNADKKAVQTMMGEGAVSETILLFDTKVPE